MLAAIPAWSGQKAAKPEAAPDGFDPAKLETLAGTVTAVTGLPPSSRNGYVGMGVKLAVQTPSGETLDVPLGPRWYFEKQAVQPAVGDIITLTGIRPDPTKPLFLVSTIKKDDLTASWRDADGKLIWRRSKTAKVVDEHACKVMQRPAGQVAGQPVSQPPKSPEQPR
jgi:hypothetical protein